MDLFLHYWWMELGMVAIATLGTYASFRAQRVPELRPIVSFPPEYEDEQLRDLDFKFVSGYDATMSEQIPIRVWGYLSPDQFHSVILITVWTDTGTFSLFEFHSELSPGGNITTGTSREANIAAYPLHKIVTKVPWKKTVAEVFRLHVLLCETARENQFSTVPMDPDLQRQRLIEDTRNDLEYGVARGRMVRLPDDSYRLSFLGALLAVPRVWWKMAYGFAFGWWHPSDQAQCRRVARRLQKAQRLQSFPVTQKAVPARA
jgi:hypothetical protein